MKICLLSRYFDLRNAGVGRFSQQLLANLKQRGFHVKPISTEWPGSVGYFVYTALEIPTKLPRDCTIYHSLTPLEAIYIPKNKGVVTFHDLIPWLYLDKIQTHYTYGKFQAIKKFISSNYFAFCSKIASKCQTLVCTSESVKREIIENLHVKDEKIKLIRYGIDKKFMPLDKKDKIFRIGTLSYLDPRKRIDFLIQSFLETNVDGELVIAGRGIENARLKELADNDQRIKFLGFIADENIVEFYNSLDYFIFPTKVEGYGLPIVEAFACKKPVIVLEDAFIPEEIKSRCTIVKNLVEFFKNPIVTSDLDSNYQFAKLHDWDKCVKDYIDIYNQTETKI